MSTKPKILHLCGSCDAVDPQLTRLGDSFEIVSVQNPIRAFLKICREPFAGVYVSAEHAEHLRGVARLLQNERVLQSMPDGVTLIDAHNIILWANAKLMEWTGRDELVGEHFYTVMGNPEILGPDFGPFSTALATGSPSTTTLRCPSNRYYRIHAAPVLEKEGPPQNLIVTVHDVTAEELQQQKLAAIHKAGADLANLTAEELFQMSIEDRIELLKSNILHYTQHLLNFDVVEIRLLDKKSNRLMPLLAVGMEPAACERELYREVQGNGVTGYVAATGKSYLCDDTTQDPLYLEGCRGAKSSLTVPLVLHDTVGTFNVESPQPRAFTEQDRQFLEIFSRNVAAALNTLELLSVEKVTATATSVEAIHSAVALPVDVILNDAVNIMESYLGHEPDVIERLQRILRNARYIKQEIQEVGRQMAPVEALPTAGRAEERPLLKGLTVLVVDSDDTVRVTAHNLLERFGCIVETAHDGSECLKMVRNFSGEMYNVIIADIRLPDMDGYELYCALKQEQEHIPLVLMTGYGYDPKHAIVKSRQAGLKHVLYKPFRLDQLLAIVEQVAQEFPSPARAS